MAALAGLSLVWVERAPIATRLIDRSLGRAGVSARYRIVGIGLGRQRLADVVIGDPAHPDLTADRVEIGTGIGPGGPRITAVRVHGLRLRATLANGRLSLGSLDRLLPASGGGDTTRPAIDADVDDGRLLLSTPAGPVRVRLDGRGRLDDGFEGRLVIGAARLAAGGCVVEGVAATTRVSLRRGGSVLRGPVQATRAACGTVGGVDLRADVTAALDPAGRRWSGDARLAATSPGMPGARLARLGGRVTFAGSAGSVAGALALAGADGAVGDAGAGTVRLAGRYAIARTAGFTGQVEVANAHLPPRLLARIADGARLSSDAPVAPLVARLASALAAAGRDFEAAASITADRAGVVVTDLTARTRSGARFAFAGGRGLTWPLAGPAGVDGRFRGAGGGLPGLAASLVQARPGAPLRGVLTLAPMAAGGAALRLAPVRFAVMPGGAAAIDTAATLSGPVPGGRVERLSLPVLLRRDPRGVLLVAPGCTVVRFDALTLSAVRLRAASIPLCPTGRAIARVAGGTFGLGARTAALRLSGSAGGTPLVLSARAASAANPGGFTVADLFLQLGTGEGASRVAVATLSGAPADGGLRGRLVDAGGQIGAVPLKLSRASGGWRVRGGALEIEGTAMVADTAAAPRLAPARVDGLTLALANGTIDVRGRLVSPARSVPIARLAITHRLPTGAGEADLVVSRLSFVPGFQPDDLTPLTRGVIADVRGSIDGDGRIAWGSGGVTSTGRFRTDGLDLAAAFGPVTGLAGTITFTDLLALASAPGQVFKVASIDPGIPVTDGEVEFRTLPGARVAVAGAHWPFAGGALDLQPTLLDLGGMGERRLTFALRGVDAGRFLQQFDFSNMNATGIFDGALPMIFDESGGRIENGRLRVRRGGGNLAYLGELTQKDLGTWGNLAFQALRSIDYRDLAIDLNGPLAGEMVTEVRFAGISQGRGARSNFLIRRLQKLPIVFNIRIRAPFRGLIDGAQSFYDPTRLVERNLPALLRVPSPSPREPGASQPGESPAVAGATH